jgi:hypothetical protein
VLHVIRSHGSQAVPHSRQAYQSPMSDSILTRAGCPALQAVKLRPFTAVLDYPVSIDTENIRNGLVAGLYFVMLEAPGVRAKRRLIIAL